MVWLLRKHPSSISAAGTALISSCSVSRGFPALGGIRTFGVECIVRCLHKLQDRAQLHDGLDYLQVFEDDATERRLWFIEDSDGGAITALLPSDY